MGIMASSFLWVMNVGFISSTVGFLQGFHKCSWVEFEVEGLGLSRAVGCLSICSVCIPQRVC